MAFVHLHCHSHYSLLDGLSRPEQMVEHAKFHKMPALAITDHGVLYGAIEFYNLCKEAGIKPIIGMEAYVATRRRFDKENKVDNDYYHLTLLAKNFQGYQNLMKLSTLAHTQGFYYKPRVDKEILRQYNEGLIALSGCPRGELNRKLSTSIEQGLQTLEEYQNIFGKENFYIEIQRTGHNDSELALGFERLIDLAKNTHTPIVATQDAHYVNKEDANAQDVLVCIGTGKTIHDVDRLDMREHDLSMRSPQEMLNLFQDLPEAINNTLKIAESTAVEIPINQRYFPKVQLPENTSAEDFLTQTVLAKASEKYPKNQENKVDEQILKRINYELDIICKKGFATYFLMVADIVHGAHSIGAITNTRGSAAGSIVGHILGITNVDPLLYELPFERFLTLHRPTPPDIDLDISDTKRDKAIEYITNSYGSDRVAQIITFGTMMARAAIRDVGRALGIAYSKCDRIAKMVPFGKQGFQMTLDKALELSPEFKEAYTRDPETQQIINIAKKLEGCCRHASIHAAGIIITPMPLTDIVPLQKEPDGERLITQYDMYSLDVNAKGNAIGAIKMDLLGIRNLSILEYAVDLVKKRHGQNVDIYNLPHPDPKTFQLLADGLTFGVFQLGSSGMTRYLKELKPSNIFDLSAMIALYRPGPLQFIPDYIARKHNPKLITYLDPALEKILKRTYGILVYQDDLLTIAHDLAGYSWEEVDKFRKAVGKKNPEEMAKQKIKFIEGCVKTAGWSRNKATEVWAWIEPFAAYGFNKSHSASYAVVSYQTAYMKANFPVEFMAAVMTAESGNEDKIYAAVEECKNLNIQVLPPDVNESLGDFTVVDSKTIRFGLNAIKNLGSDVVDKIIDIKTLNEQPAKSNQEPFFKTLEDFLIKAYTKNLNKKSWEALVKAGALDAFGERNFLLRNTERVLDYLRERFKVNTDGQNSLFGKTFQIGRLKLEPAPAATPQEMLAWEKELLGLYVSSHPLNDYKLVLKNLRKLKTLNELADNTPIYVGGIISKLKKTLTKKNDPMAFFTLQDTTTSLEVLVFPKTMIQAVPYLEVDKIIEVTGKISHKDEEVKIIADKILPLPNDELYSIALTEMEKNKQVVIHLSDAATKQTLGLLKIVLEKYPGQAEVFLKLGSLNRVQKIKTQTKISLSPQILAELTAFPEVISVGEK